MSTRSAVFFKESRTAPADIVLLNHHDGYPKYFGVKLAMAVIDATLDDKFNTLTAIERLKWSMDSGLRISSDKKAAGDEEYLYDVYLDAESDSMRIGIYDKNEGEEIFDGTPEQLISTYKTARR